MAFRLSLRFRAGYSRKRTLAQSAQMQTPSSKGEIILERGLRLLRVMSVPERMSKKSRGCATAAG